MKKKVVPKAPEAPSPPPGWRFAGRRTTCLTRDIRFHSGQVLVLYAVYILVLAARRRVAVTLACSGRCLSVTLLESPELGVGASQRLLNLAARIR